MLGIASSAVVVASRSRSSSSSRFRRSVMSRPPETMLTTRPCGVLHGCGAPVDGPNLASRVRERVLILARRKVGSERLEPRDHLILLDRVDEKRPVVLAESVLLLVPARFKRGGVDAPDAAVGSDVHEQARRRVRDGGREAHLGSQLGLQSVVLERQRRGSGNGLHEFRLGVERGVVDDGGHAGAVVFDHRDRPLAFGRVGRSTSLWIDPAGASEPALRVNPVQDVELGLTQCAGESVAKRSASLECDDELGHRRAREAYAQDAQQEGERNCGETRQEDGRKGISGVDRNELAQETVDDQSQEGRPTRDEHGPQRSPQRSRRSTPSPNHQHDSDERENDPGGRVEPIDSRDGPRSVRDQQRVLRAAVALGVGSRVEQRRHQRQPDDDDPDDPRKDPVEARLEATRWVREQQRRERNECKPAEDEARDVDPGVVRFREHADEPQIADRGEIGPRPILGPPPQRDQAGGHERNAGGHRQHDRTAEVGLVVARLDQRDRDAHLEDGECASECERETTQARRAETRSPDSSPLGTNPHAHDAVTSSP